MNKTEFLSRLERMLKSLGKEERKRYLTYYEEMIEDYMEDGCSEEEAVAKIGGPGVIAQSILEEQEEQTQRKLTSGMKVGVGILLVLGSPLWGSLVLAALACLLSVLLLVLSAYVLIWCIPLVTGAFAVSGLILSVVSIAGSSMLLFQNASLGVVQLGAGIAAAGVFIAGILLTWILGKIFVKVTVNFSKWLMKPIQRLRGAEV